MKNDLTSIETALELLRRGIWPVPIKPKSKASIGDDWGAERPTEESLSAVYAAHPAGGVGIRLGPESGVIDLEVDGPEGEASLRELCGGDPVTLGCSSRRGPHHFFRFDPRLAKYGKSIIKVPELPGLEIRIGGDGKQLQSNCPPTIGDDGQPRRWNDCDVIAELPESVFIYLDEYTSRPPRVERQPAAPKARGSSFTATASNGPRVSDLYPDKTSPEARARAYVFSSGFPASIAGEHGHDALYRCACELVDGFGLSESLALPILLDWNRDKAKPPETEKQVEHKLADAIKNHPAPSLKRLNANQLGGGSGSPSGNPAASPAASGPPAFNGPPRPLSVELLPVPSLEPAMLPESLRGWLADGAERMSVPLDYSAAAALVALAAVVGRKLCVRPKRRDDWLVCPNLWGAAVGPPSVLKSACIQEALRHLHRLVAEAQKDHAQALAAFEQEALIAKAKADAAKQKLKKAAGQKTPPPESVLRELAREAALAEGMEPPPARRFIVNDATVEKLGELLAQNPNGLLQFRDELMGFFRSMDRQGHESDRGFYLEAWNGFGSYTYDRIGRGTIIIPSICLSIFGGIQPGPLARYLRASASGDQADGFIPRFQLIVYPDLPSQWHNVDRWPDTVAKNRAFSVFKAIDGIDPATIGAGRDDEQVMFQLGFMPEAQELFDDWRTALENRLRSGSDSPLMVIHLGKYRSLMPTLGLLFHLVEIVDGRAGAGPINLIAAQAAAAWCEYLEAHARRIYQSALDGDPEAAMQLAERIKASLPNPFTARDVVRKGWSGLDSTDAVERALLALEDREWVKSVNTPSGPSGGQPTVRYWVNPALRPALPHGAPLP